MDLPVVVIVSVVILVFLAIIVKARTKKSGDPYTPYYKLEYKHHKHQGIPSYAACATSAAVTNPAGPCPLRKWQRPVDTGYWQWLDRDEVEDESALYADRAPEPGVGGYQPPNPITRYVRDKVSIQQNVGGGALGLGGGIASTDMMLQDPLLQDPSMQELQQTPGGFDGGMSGDLLSVAPGAVVVPPSAGLPAPQFVRQGSRWVIQGPPPAIPQVPGQQSVVYGRVGTQTVPMMYSSTGWTPVANVNGQWIPTPTPIPAVAPVAGVQAPTRGPVPVVVQQPTAAPVIPQSALTSSS